MADVGTVTATFRVRDEFSAPIASASQKFGSLTSQLRAASPFLSTIGLGLTSIGAAAVASAIKVDDALDTIRLGTGKTGKELESLHATFRRVGGSVPNDLAQVGTAIADLNTRTGATGDRLEALATQTLTLSRITKTDLGSVIQSSTRLFGDWSIASERQSGALDTVFRASQETGIGVGRLMTQLVQFGAPLREFGFGFEESAALMGKWEKEGVNAELVFGSLRQAIGHFAREGVPLREGLAATIEKIQALGESTEASSLAMEVFGSRAATDAKRAILEGRFAVEELVTTIRDGRETILGAAQDTDGLRESFARWRNELQLVLAPAAELLAGSGPLILLVAHADKIKAAFTGAAGAVGLFHGALLRLAPLALPLAALAALYLEVERGTKSMRDSIAQLDEGARLMAAYRRVTGDTTRDVIDFSRWTDEQKRALLAQAEATGDLTGQYGSLSVTLAAAQAGLRETTGATAEERRASRALTDEVEKLTEAKASLVIQARAWSEFAGGPVGRLPEGVQRDYHQVLQRVIDQYGSLRAAGLGSLQAVYVTLDALVGKTAQWGATIAAAGGAFAGLRTAPFDPLGLSGLITSDRAANFGFLRGLPEASLAPASGYDIRGFLRLPSGTAPAPAFDLGQGGLFDQMFGQATSGGRNRFSLTDFGQGLSQTILGSLMGGGDLGRSIASYSGQSLMTSLTSKIGGSITKALGGVLGGTLNAFLPGAGALLGPLAAKGIGALGRLFGIGESGQARRDREATGSVRDLAAQITAQYGGTPALLDLERRLGFSISSGFTSQGERGLGQFQRDIQEFERRAGAYEGLNATLREIQRTGQDLPGAWKPFLEDLARSGRLADDVRDSILGLQADTLPNWREMQQVAQEYGIDLAALGPKFEQAKLTDLAKKYAADFKLLIGGGADMNAVLDGMADKANSVVLTARKFGLEVPADMRGMLEELIKNRRLLDENGEAFESLEATGLTFAETTEKAIGRLVDALTKFLDLMGIKLPKEIDAARKKFEEPWGVPWPSPAPGPQFPGSPEFPGAPGFSVGTPSADYVDFHRGRLVVTHGEEAIVPRRGGPHRLAREIVDAMGGASTTNHFYVTVNGDAASVAAFLARHKRAVAAALISAARERGDVRTALGEVVDP